MVSRLGEVHDAPGAMANNFPEDQFSIVDGVADETRDFGRRSGPRHYANEYGRKNG